MTRDHDDDGRIKYVCSVCGAADCKLWREHQTVAPALYCVRCAEEHEDRRLTFGHGSTDQIGWLVPAVLDAEGKAFWGYSSVPQDRVEWWKALPIGPPMKTQRLAR
jgi:hypothetical protein